MSTSIDRTPSGDPSASWPRATSGVDGAAPPVGDDHPEAVTPPSADAGPAPAGGSNLVRLAIAAAVVIVGLRLFGPYIFYIIGALVLSIVLHELGHFWVARASGMKVTEAFVGFGPRLGSFRRGEVEYGVKAIPAGAYVKIIGMSDFEEVDPADEARTYRAQGTFKRLATVMAGPAMNFLIAFVLMTTMFAVVGRESDAWSVKVVTPGSAAAAAGVQPGDRILAVDGEPVGRWDSFRGQLAEKAGRATTFTIERDGARTDLPVALGWRLSADAATKVPSDPALGPGDIVESADGQALARYDDLRALLAQPGDPVTLRVVRADNPYDLRVSRPLALPADGGAGFLGVQPNNETAHESVLGAMAETGRVMRDGAVATGTVFKRFVTPSGLSDYANQIADATQPTTTLAPGAVGRLTPVDGSPAPTAGANLREDRPISIIGITMLGSEAAQAGLASFVLLVAGVNLALGLLNLVPMLPLDGGHAAIACYEGVRGRLQGKPYRADLTKLMPFVYAFVAMLVLLGVSSMLLDTLRPPSLR